MDFGWINLPSETAQIVASLPMPEAEPPLLRAKEPTLLYKHVRQVLGRDLPKGPQGIGDCVGWGFAGLNNVIAALQVYKQMLAKDVLFVSHNAPQVKHDARAVLLDQYQETAVEWIYGGSRVEIGKQRGSTQDGSTGAWAAKFISTYGTLSRAYLQSKGLSGPYDAKRSKQWGAQGVPDSLEPAARQHLIRNVSLVTNFEKAAALIENGYPVAVCSSQGFSGRRDSQGFDNPRGRWDHCMYFLATRWDRPGLLCAQSWGPNTPSGPIAYDQPDNTFWVDSHVVDSMLSRRDSWTGTEFDGYKVQDEFNGDWSH